MSSQWFERLLLHHQDHGLQPPVLVAVFFFTAPTMNGIRLS